MAQSFYCGLSPPLSIGSILGFAVPLVLSKARLFVFVGGIKRCRVCCGRSWIAFAAALATIHDTQTATLPTSLVDTSFSHNTGGCVL